MNSFTTLSVLAFVLALARLSNTQDNQEQVLKLWTAKNCEGVADYTVYNSVSNNINPGNLYTIYLTYSGLWSMEFCYNETDCPIRNLLSYPDSGCQSVHLDGLQTKYIITRFGDANQEETKLYLYPEEQLVGEPLIVDEAGMTEMDFVAKSYFFTGKHAWGYTVSEEDEYVTWLHPTESVANDGFGITMNLHANIIIHSIQMANEEPEPTTEEDTTGPTTTGPTTTGPTTTGPTTTGPTTTGPTTTGPTTTGPTTTGPTTTGPTTTGPTTSQTTSRVSTTPKSNASNVSSKYSLMCLTIFFMWGFASL